MKRIFAASIYAPFKPKALDCTGFTLIELLISVGIISVLAALVIPITSSSLEKARSVNEINGARSAIQAWQLYAADNNGTLLPGYLSMSQAAAAGVKNGSGNPVAFPMNARYPFRLAPYLNNSLKGSLLVNKQAKLTSDYEISMSPSFGVNLTFVGGDWGSGSDLAPTDANLATYGKFVVTRLAEIHSPGQLVVFASARYTDPSFGNSEGYNAIKSPNLTTQRWADQYDEKRPYYDYGSVHPRFDGRAVCAMADGHVELLTLDDLRDMRRWSNQAAEADDPDWTLQTQ